MQYRYIVFYFITNISILSTIILLSLPCQAQIPDITMPGSNNNLKESLGFSISPSVGDATLNQLTPLISAYFRHSFTPIFTTELSYMYIGKASASRIISGLPSPASVEASTGSMLGICAIIHPLQENFCAGLGSVMQYRTYGSFPVNTVMLPKSWTENKGRVYWSLFISTTEKQYVKRQPAQCGI